jgi:ubiquinone/menaquinone biosynthesis C-methylase UbiE
MSDTVERYWRKRDAEGYDSRADRSGRMKAYQWMAAQAKPHLTKEGAVSMDLGCGTGIFAKAVGIKNIIGVDMSPTMLEIARTRMERVYEEDIFDLRLEQNSVDNVITLFVLADYPSEKKRDFLQQVYSCLKQGGRFFFSAYSPNDGYMGKSARERSTMRDGGGSFEVYLEDASTYQNMLEYTGFRIEKIGTIGSEGPFERDSKMISFDREFIVIVTLKE